MSPDSTPVFHEDERDAAAELLNIGIGRAAASLSRMLDKEVVLAVPRVHFVPVDELASRLGEDGLDDVALVVQPFRGAFDGQAMVVFPEQESHQLARLLLQDDLADNADLERDALTEVGNVVLNGCLGSLANVIRGEFVAQAPKFARCHVEGLLDTAADKSLGTLLLAEVSFSIKSHDIRGLVLLALPVDSIEGFRESIAKLFAG